MCPPNPWPRSHALRELPQKVLLQEEWQELLTDGDIEWIWSLDIPCLGSTNLFFLSTEYCPSPCPSFGFYQLSLGGKKKKKSPKPGLLMKFEFMSKSPSSLFYHCFIWKNKNLILFMMYTFGLVKLYFSSKQTAFCRWLNSIWFMVEVNYLLLRYSTRTEAAWYGHLHCSICRGV